MPKAQGTALVTGSAIRLGKAISQSLAQAGYNIALHYNSSQEAALATADEFRSYGVECDLFPFDLLNEPDMNPLVERVRSRFGDLNVLVNSASVYDAAPIAETTLDLFEKQFKVNFQAPYFLTQAFAKNNGSGCVINIIDNKVAFNQYQYSAYLLSKKALAEFTKLAAIELAPAIRVNGIAPGFILPVSTRTQDYVEWLIDGIPVKQQGSTENIVKAVHYILDNSFVAGQILFVDGGESLTNVGRNAVTYEQITQIKQ
ncbi:MAG: SDR family oxidoreductase [Limnothrix sp. BL-A-16]|jgi:pteridine reductase